MAWVSKRSFLISIGLAIGSAAIPAAVTESVAAESNYRWHSYQADAQNRGYNHETSSPVTKFNREWQFETRNRVGGSAPVWAEGILYVGSSDRSLYAIDTENGTKEWAFDTSASVGEPPVVIGDSVVVVNQDRDVYGVDRTDGSELWSRTENPYRHTPLPHDGLVYITARNGVVGLDAETGKTQWTSEEIDENPTAGPAYSNGTLFVCADFTVYAFDISDGAKRWSFDVGGRIDVVPTVHDGIVYIGAQNDRVYALDAETGDELWDYNTGNQVLSSPAVRDETVYVASFGADNATHAINTSDGSQKWVFEYGTHGTGGPSLIITDEVVYVSRTNELYVVDIETGEEIDRLRLNDRISTTPCIVNGILYFGSRDHNIYAYSGSSERQADFEVGQFRLYSESVPTDLGDTDITVPIGAEVRFTFSVSNTGIAKGEFNAVVRLNDTVIDEQTISINAGGHEEIRVERTFDETGEYEVSLNETVYGTVVVEDGAVGEDGVNSDSESRDGEIVAEDLPGFGIPAAAAGVGGAIAYALYRGDSAEESNDK